MELNHQIASALIELKQASLSLQEDTSNETWHDLIERYDMLFLGEKFNIIYCRELVHTLNVKFQISISIEDLLSVIPQICSTLGMKTDPLVRLEDVGNPSAPIAEYSIRLF